MKRLTALASVLLSLWIVGRAQADCMLARLAELPVTMVGARPLAPAEMNGTDVQLLVDSGAFFSMISRASAKQLDLPTSSAPFGFFVTGVGGATDISIAKVRTFGIAKANLHDVQFIVGGSEVGSSAIGLLGQNVLGLGDVEYDLPDGVVRLFRPRGCGGRPMAYWANMKPYSMLSIEPLDTARNHTIGVVKVNGIDVTAMFDTGADTTILSLRAAARAGVTPQSPGVTFAGYSRGIGRNQTKTWIVPVSSLQIGDEIIKTTRVRIGDVADESHDMLIGADFFLSHRVYVANSQHKLYFTYNGGPVFNLSSTGANAAPAGGASAVAGGDADPADADGFSRRGSALAARGETDRAIADFVKATELAPTEPSYFYQLAMARLTAHQPFMAMTALDAELKLKPGDAQARFVRAELRLVGQDREGAAADLEAASDAAPKEADLRLNLAELDLRLDRFAPAVAQFDLWIADHGDDNRMATARNGRCWARALAGVELDKALADCNVAVRLTHDAADPLDSRGLVYVRRAEFKRAIADYDAALALRPKSAWSFYGRGLAELKSGEQTKGDADIAAATALAPKLPRRAAQLGLAASSVDMASPAPGAGAP